MSVLTFYYFTSTFYSHWLVLFLLDLYGLYGSGGFHRDRLIPWSRSNRWRGVINIPRTLLCLCNSNPVPGKRHLADFVETSTMATHSDNPVKGELCMSKCLYNGHHIAAMDPTMPKTLQRYMRELIYILTLPHAVLTMTSIIYVLNCLILDHVLNSILFLVISIWIVFAISTVLFVISW